MIQFNTGIDDLGEPLPLGSLDTHWRLMSGLGITGLLTRV
jgi:hypothetical protein